MIISNTYVKKIDEAREQLNKNLRIRARDEEELKNIVYLKWISGFIYFCAAIFITSYIILDKSKVLRMMQNQELPLYALVLIFAFISGYFGMQILATIFARTRGDSTVAAYMLSFFTLGAYSVFIATRFLFNTKREEFEKDIVKIDGLLPSLRKNVEDAEKEYDEFLKKRYESRQNKTSSTDVAQNGEITENSEITESSEITENGEITENSNTAEKQ